MSTSSSISTNLTDGVPAVPPDGVPLLELDHLGVRASAASGRGTLVEDCSLRIAPGEAVGLVGESGSGKTLSVRSVAGLLPDGFTTSGTIRYAGTDLDSLSAGQRRALRARRTGMIFQTPRTHLNPLRTIGDFMTEALVTVAGSTRADADRKAVQLLGEVGVPQPEHRMRQRPAQLSGGLLQRVMIASALAMDPDLLLADEITTALDVTTQEEVMAILEELREQRHMALLFITHDLALASAVCDRIAVMQQGRTIETLDADRMEATATQEYTRTLLRAATTGRAGAAPSEDEAAGGGVEGPRPTPLLEMHDLRKVYKVRGGELTAVDGIGFELRPGESLGIVGESGSGKSTTARILCGLERSDGGVVKVGGERWTRPARTQGARRSRAKKVQMVFQDPFLSLSPRQTVRQCLTDAVRVQSAGALPAGVEARVAELAAAVHLDEELLDSRPGNLSGGQCQRVAIARALAAEPQILVLDEAVSALDVTTQVEVLELLDRIRRGTGVALLMITHDLTVVRHRCDWLVVMKSGRIEEQGRAADIMDSPKAEYTRQLIESIPRPGWKPRRRSVREAQNGIAAGGARGRVADADGGLAGAGQVA